MMNNISLIQRQAIILIAFISFAAGSCCTDKLCLGADNMNFIQFNNFSNNDLDTIVIERFSKNTKFATVLESTTVTTTNFSESPKFQWIMLPIQLTVDFDYKVKLKSTGEDFAISDFITKKESCNTGFMCNDSYNSLESYKVNGQLTGSYQLEITR